MNSSKVDPNNKSPDNRANILLRLLGPGLVTGAADDDPSGIATYSQAGAQFGYGLRCCAALVLDWLTRALIASVPDGEADLIERIVDRHKSTTWAQCRAIRSGLAEWLLHHE
jgi:hypothetical protein